VKTKLVMIVIALIVALGALSPTVASAAPSGPDSADPDGPDWCGQWSEKGPWWYPADSSYPSGYWWEWDQTCHDHYRGSYDVWGDWDGPYPHP
jgi:hypothetical protein